MDYKNLICLHEAIDHAGLDAMEKFRIKTLIANLIYIHEVGGIESAEEEVVNIVAKGMNTKRYKNWAKSNEHNRRTQSR